MVGTPNHGAGFVYTEIGEVGSTIFKKHAKASRQLYAGGPFLHDLNRGEAGGYHLRPFVQYGNIYGLPDDWVVEGSSAFLNGVRSRYIENAVHSPLLPMPGEAITESKTIWGWIEQWLTHDIPRSILKNFKVNIVSGSGHVFRHTLQLKSGKIWEGYNDITKFPATLKPWEDIGTGPGSKALINLAISGHRWGNIFVNEKTLLELGFLSPGSVSLRVRKGSARFVSFNRKNGGHFEVVVGPKTAGKWYNFHPHAKIIGLDTDFVVTTGSGNDIRVDILEGRVRLKTSAIRQDKAQVFHSGQAVEVSAGGKVAVLPVSSKKWWKDKFYTDHPGQKTNSVPVDRNLLRASADAYVYAYKYRNWNRSNRGKYDQLMAGWHPAGGESRAYIRFDLSGVNAAAVRRAVLRLYYFQTSGGTGVKLGIYRVTSPWGEGSDTYHSGQIEKTAPPGSISWVHQPGTDPAPVAVFNPGNGLREWTDVDITSLVRKWGSGASNYGLVIRAAGKLSANIAESVYHFASRERDSGLDKPGGKYKGPVLMLYHDMKNGTKVWGKRIKTHIPAGGKLINGNFEAGPGNLGRFATLGTGSNSLPGWRIERGSIDIVGTYWQQKNGHRSIDLCGSSCSTLTQTFAAVPGKTYVLSFDLAGNFFHSGVKLLQVKAGDQVRSYQFDTKGKNAGNMGWQRQALRFTATSGSLKISFVAPDNINDAYCGPAIDNVNIRPAD